MITRSMLRDDLQRLGVRMGDLLMLHASIRAVGPIMGGASVLLQALFDAIGPRGTLAAYVDFEPFYDIDSEHNPADIPAFDKQIARAARDHGILHETLRTWPGALRSDHPDAGVAAIGPLAPHVTAGHPFQYGYGGGSPFERIFQANGRVLMLGAPLDSITLLHYAEHKANIPNKRVVRYRRWMADPKAPQAAAPQWNEFEEFDTSRPVHACLPEDCFAQIARDHLAAGFGRRDKVGNAEAHLFDAGELVPFAIEWLENFVGAQTRRATRE